MTKSVTPWPLLNPVYWWHFQLVLTALNSSKSAYASFTLIGNKFFSKYHYRGVNGQTKEKFNCKIYNKVCTLILESTFIFVGGIGLCGVAGSTFGLQGSSRRSNARERHSCWKMRCLRWGWRGKDQEPFHHQDYVQTWCVTSQYSIILQLNKSRRSENVSLDVWICGSYACSVHQRNR